tara:strand:+ start:552 stop:1061 length:510 start_codon:yes stop_codon:yes gene_type:complete
MKSYFLISIIIDTDEDLSVSWLEFIKKYPPWAKGMPNNEYFLGIFESPEKALIVIKNLQKYDYYGEYNLYEYQYHEIISLLNDIFEDEKRDLNEKKLIKRLPSDVFFSNSISNSFCGDYSNPSFYDDTYIINCFCDDCIEVMLKNAFDETNVKNSQTFNTYANMLNLPY